MIYYTMHRACCIIRNTIQQVKSIIWCNTTSIHTYVYILCIYAQTHVYILLHKYNKTNQLDTTRQVSYMSV